jgi:hypothetical protein
MTNRETIGILTPEQEALIPIYRDKWVPIVSSTATLDRDREIAAINTAYRLSNYPAPEILFYHSPFDAIRSISRSNELSHIYLGRSLSVKFSKRVLDHLQHMLDRQICRKLSIKIGNQMSYCDPPYYWTEEYPIRSCFHNISFPNCLTEQISRDLEIIHPELEYQDTSEITNNITRTAQWAALACRMDFYISVLNLQHDRKIWQAIQRLIYDCGFIMMFERVCIACPRPTKMIFDADNRLHGDLESALEFPDGYAVYAHHGEIHNSYDNRDKFGDPISGKR